jgi:ATP/maltotriose-dependent transcriptional regulator MalT
VPSFPDVDAVVAAVTDAVERDDHEAARAALYPVLLGHAFLDGPGFRQLITSLPEAMWHDDVAITTALGQSFRSAGSPPGSAALAYFSAAEKAVARAKKVDAGDRVGLLIGHAAALRTQGRLQDAMTTLSEAGHLLDNENHGPGFVQHSARFALELGVAELMSGRLDSARHRLEVAVGLAESHLTMHEMVEAMGALALAAYSQGDLAAADRLLASIAQLDLPESVTRSGFAAPGYAADILVASDRYEQDRVPALADAMVAASIHTEWEPLANVVSAYSHALLSEPIPALDLLHQAHQQYMNWKPAGIGLDIGELLRADILSALDRGDEAFEILSHMNPHERHALCPERYMARIALQHGDLRGADLALQDCEMLGGGHSPRTLIDVQLLRSAIEMERGDLRLSDVSFDRALHAMAKTRVRSPFRHVPPALLAKLTDRALKRTQSAEAARILGKVAEATDGQVDDRDPLSERERMVLVYVERKLTVAQIAAELFISPNTVKTHLRRLYSKLGVTTREEAIRKARSLGLHLGNAK